MDNPPPLRFAWKPLLVQSQLTSIVIMAQFQTHLWTDQKPVSKVTLDGLLLHFLLFAGVNFAVVFALDRLARRKGWWKRPYYLAIGGLASSAAHAVALAPAGYIYAVREGTLLLILGVPIAIGIVTGFLLHKSLGYATEGDDPHALFQAATPGASGSAVLDIGSAQYYEGPLQVRTSAIAGVLAAFAGAALYVFISLLSMNDGVALPVPPLGRQNPILFAIYGICGISVLFYLFVMRSHSFLQRRGKTAMKSYALAGIFVPLGFAAALLALMGPFAIIIVLPWMLPSVLAMLVYQRVAGFEPLDLPDDIEVRDPRTMLPADHVRRRVRRIVPSQ